jgi:hypothetical protein
MCCISDKMDGREDEEEVENVGSEHEVVRQKMGNVKPLML